MNSLSKAHKVSVLRQLFRKNVASFVHSEDKLWWVFVPYPHWFIGQVRRRTFSTRVTTPASPHQHGVRSDLRAIGGHNGCNKCIGMSTRTATCEGPAPKCSRIESASLSFVPACARTRAGKHRLVQAPHGGANVDVMCPSTTLRCKRRFCQSLDTGGGGGRGGGNQIA